MTDDTLEITRHFDAPPERVFDAWLQDGWGAWIGPREATGEIVLLEPRVGGRYQASILYDGRTMSLSGVYREFQRPEKIRMTWKWGHDPQETEITLSFRPKGTGTELTLRQTGFASTERRDGHVGGWNVTLEKLAEYLAR